MALLLETLWGDLVIDLDIDGSPELCKNILKLAHARYYTNTLIFSVTAQRFCQLGCPVGDGSGGACIYGLIDALQQQENIETFNYCQSKRRFLRSVGRALTQSEFQEKGRVVATLLNHTPDTIGSQFLITTASGPNRALDGYRFHSGQGSDSTLAPQFLSLGKVAEDDNNVLDRINAAYTDPDGRPYADIRIIRALVIYDPFVKEEIPGFDLLLKSRGVVVEEFDSATDSNNVLRRVIDSPSPVQPVEESVPKRISAADVTLEDEDENEVDEEERIKKRLLEEEDLAKKEDRSRAVVLEMLGDLPDANIRAPENVLFICKLNPATIDEDLELIFSRFDEKVRVEIIRDYETGASLQYAFAEFTNQQAAAEAYFKMNNALIDDRRIKVDFSQSVSKLWDKYNQRMRMPRISTNGGHGNTERSSDERGSSSLRIAVHASQQASRYGDQKSSFIGGDLKHINSRGHRNDRHENAYQKNDSRRHHTTRFESNHRSRKYDSDTLHRDERNVDAFNERGSRIRSHEHRALEKDDYRKRRHIGAESSFDRKIVERDRGDGRFKESDDSTEERRHRRKHHKSHNERSSHHHHHHHRQHDRSFSSDEEHHRRERQRREDDNGDRKQRKHSQKHRKRDRDSSQKRHKRSRSYSS